MLCDQKTNVHQYDMTVHRVQCYHGFGEHDESYIATPTPCSNLHIGLCTLQVVKILKKHNYCPVNGHRAKFLKKKGFLITSLNTSIVLNK